MFRPCIPVNTTGTIASPAVLSCHLRRWRLQRNADVARHPLEPYPESAAIVRCVLRAGLRAARVPASLELATRRGVRP
jgi:hypothetical protein